MFILQISEPRDTHRRVYLHLVDSADGTTAKTGQTGKAWISKNGATPVQTKNSITEVDASNAPGLYYVELSVAETSTAGWIQIRYKASGTLEFQDIGQMVAYDPFNSSIGGANQSPLFAGGADIDYKKIDKIVEKHTSAIKLPAIPKPEKVDLSPVIKAVQEISKQVTNIKFPEQKPFEYEPILEAIDSMKTAFMNIKIPEPQEPDLNPILQEIRKANLKQFQEDVESLFERIKDFFDGDIEAFKDTAEDIKEKLNQMPYVVLEPKKPKSEDDDMEEETE